MPTILKIGYHHYLVKNEQAAVKALQAFAGAISLKPHYSKGRDYFTVETESGRHSEFAMMTIRADQILKTEPPDDDAIDVPARRRGMLLNEHNQ